MTDLREAAQAVLGRWDSPRWEWSKHGPTADLMAALRAALAEPAQEPVAWTGYDLDAMVEAFDRVIEAHFSKAHPFHDPTNMDAKMALRILRGFIPAMKAYTAPPQRKPLTADETMSILNATAGHHWCDEAHIQRFRAAIEKAHGIE